MRRGGEDVLEHRHAAERPRNLMRAREPQPAALGRRGGDVLAAEAHRPLVGACAPTSTLSKVVLPAPFGPTTPDRLVGADRKIDSIQHHKRAEALRQAFRLKQKAIGLARRTFRARSAVSC